MLERAMRVSAAALTAAAADGQWACLAGDAIDDVQRLRNHRTAAELATSAAKVRGVGKAPSLRAVGGR